MHQSRAIFCRARREEQGCSVMFSSPFTSRSKADPQELKLLQEQIKSLQEMYSPPPPPPSPPPPSLPQLLPPLPPPLGT